MPADGRTPEYMAWQNMVQRCTNPKFRQYRDYGGRGIRVYPDWLGRGGFRLFLQHVGNRPAGTTLDRIDNDKGYEPCNVRWANRKTQNRNSSKNVFLTVRGETKTLAEWCELTGVPHSTLRYRLARGVSPEEVIMSGRRGRKGRG
jgi:hypothetical protein